MSTSGANVDAIIDYIQAVDLVHHGSNNTEGRVPRATGFVNAGAIQVFSNSLPDQQREDALDWILFGQLATDKAADDNGYSRVSDPERWYETFVGFLSRIGMRSDRWERHRVDPSRLHETVAKTALNFLKPLLSRDDQPLLEQAFHDLRLPVNKKALDTFNDTASNDSGANFMLLGASVDRYLNLTLHLTCMDFQSEQPVRNMLYWNWERDQVTNLCYGKDSLTLSKNLADSVRPIIRRRLSGACPDCVIPIKR